MINWLRALALVATSSLLAACGGGDDHPPSALGVAQSNPGFSILVEAVNAAGLSDTLNGPGPITVFAPTDAAFAALLAELGTTKEALLANKALLTAVLTYHVIPAKVERAQVSPGQPVTTAQGGIFKIDTGASGLTITDGRNRSARITATDLAARNGVVHVIDRVLLPADKTVVQTAQALPGFGLLVDAVLAADLAGALSAPGPFTVFAPTDAAFAALLAELGVTKEALFADKALLTQVLTYHVVPGRVLRAQVPVGTPVATLQGQTFTVDSGLAITDQRGRRAAITTTDVLATNGVIHVIDRVILPRP